MIETVSGNDNLSLNKGEEGVSSRPPSSPEIGTSNNANQAAVQVDLRSKIAGDINKNSERVSGTQKTDESMEEELKKAVDSLNEKMSRLDREIQFKIDKKINKNYISVIDKESREVIREFPPKDIRTFIARFDEFNEQIDSSSDLKSMIINLEV